MNARTVGISVVIPVFNGARYVAAAIDSALGQTLPPDEVIVVDDGSFDGTPAVLGSFGDRITIIRQSNRGGADAANRGGAAARCGILCFLDADDLWLPCKLALQVEWLATHPETDAVFGHVQQFISDDLDASEARRLACPASPQPGLAKTAMAIRRQAFERVGVFDARLASIDFVEWYGRALDCGLSTTILPQVIARRRLHASNNGRRIGKAQMADNLVALKQALDRRRSAAQRRP